MAEIRIDFKSTGGSKTLKDLNAIAQSAKGIESVATALDKLGKSRSSANGLSQGFTELTKAAKQAADQVSRVSAPKIDTKGLISLARTLGQSYGEAEKFAKSLNLTGSAANAAFQRFGELRAAGANTIQIYQALTREFGLNASQLKTLGTAYRQLEVQQAVAAKTAAKSAADARTQQQAAADAAIRAAIAQSQALKNSSNEVTRLAQSFGGTYKQALELSRGLGLTAQESRKALTQLQQLRSVGATSSQAFNALQKELGITSQQFDLLERSASQARGGVSGLNGFITGIAQGIGQAGISAAIDLFRAAIQGLQDAIAGSIQTFAAYESGIADFSSKTGLAGEQLKPLEDEIRAVNKISTQTSSDLAKTASTLVSLGASAEEAQERLRPVTLLSDSLGQEVQVVGRVVQQGIQIFGQYGASAEEVADQIQFLIDTTAAGGSSGIREFEQLFQNAGSAAATAGVQFDELGAAFATLRAGGFSSRVAATSLKTALLALASPTDKAAAELKAIGVDAFDAQGQFKGLEAVFGDFAQALRGASQEEQLRLATIVFGREGAPGFLRLLQTVDTTFAQTLENSRSNASGAVERRAEILRGTIARQADTLASTLDQLVTDFGGALAPAVVSILEVLNQIGGELIDARVFEDLATYAEDFANSLKNNPELIQRIREGAFQLVETIKDATRTTLDLLQAFAESGSAESAIANLTEILEALGNTVRVLGTLFRTSFLILDPIISPVIDGFRSLYQAVNIIADAIDAVTTRFSTLGAVVDNIPVVGAFLRGRDAAQEFKSEVEKLPAAINQAGERIVPIAEDDFLPNGDEVADRAGDIAAEANKKALDENDIFYANAQTQLEEALANQTITEEQYREQSFQDEQAYLNQRLQLNRDRLTQLRQLLETTADSDEQKKIQEEILDLEKQVLDDRTTIAQNSAEERERIEKEALDRIERANQEASDRIVRVQTERATAIRQAQLEGVLSAEEADAQIRDLEAQSSRETVAQKQRELEQVRQLRAQGTLSAEEAADRERELQGEIADLNLKAIEVQIQAQEEAKKAEIAAIQEAADAQKRATDAAVAAYERRLEAIDDVSDRLDFQNSLLESQSRLQSAISNLQQTESQGAIDRFNRALEIRQQLNQGEINSLEERRLLERQLGELGFSRNAREIDIVRARQQVEQQLAQQEQQALAAQQAQARASLELELRRQEIASRRAVIEAQIAEVQARQNVVSAQAALREAQLSGDENAIANAETQADLAQQQATLSSQAVTDTQQQVTAQNALAENARRALVAEQEAEVVRQRNAELLAQMARDAERIQAATAGTRGTGAGIEARRKGGPVKAGQPYMVGEEGPELVVPRRSGFVIPAGQTANIARQAAQAQAIRALPSMANYRVAPPPVALASNRATDGQMKAMAASLKNIERLLKDRPAPQMALNQNFAQDTPQNRRSAGDDAWYWLRKQI